MGKIKYQGGLTKLIASKIGRRNKAEFAELMEVDGPILGKKFNAQPINLRLVSFSSNNDFCDQFLSILSFLRHVGTPMSWKIYSDGSHSERQIELLSSSFSFVNVQRTNWDDVDTIYKNCKEGLRPHFKELMNYASQFPLGKRLFLYLNYDIQLPTIFLDADILFYERAAILETVLNERVNGWYLPDATWGCLDSRYTKQKPEQLYQVNGGLLLFNNNLRDLSAGLEFLRSLGGTYEYFSEQTVMHILLKDNGFMPLDPRIFVLNSGDQFDFSYLFRKEKIAVRHYTSPVRHKMWQRNWKWQLSLY